MAENPKEKGDEKERGGGDGDEKPTPRPVRADAIGVRVRQMDNGDLVIDKATQEWMDLDAQRRAATTAVPDVPFWYVPGLPDGVADSRGGGYRQVGWEALRRYREQNPALNMIHEAMQGTCRAHAELWGGRRDDVGFRVVHRDHYRPGQKAPPHFEPFIRQAEELLRRPDPSHGIYNLDDLIVPLVEDLLTINRPAIEIVTANEDANLILGIRPVDGAIIMERVNYVNSWLYENRNDDKHKTYLDDFAKNPRSGGRDLTSYISEQIREDLEGKEYVLVRSGIVEGTYSPGRIHIAPLRRRTDINYTPYQPSHVEVALELVAAYWETWDREMKVFREGLWADHLFFLTGAVDQKSFRDFLQQLRESGQGYHRSRKPMVVRGIDADAEFKSIPLKDPPTEMQFLQRFNMAMVGMCAIYQVDPSAVFHGSFQGGGRPSMNERDRGEEIQNTRSGGFKAILNHIAKTSLTQIVSSAIHPDLVVIVEYGEYDAMAEARLHEVRVKTTHSRNEMRVAIGDRPLGFYLTPEHYEAASDKDKAKHDQNPWNLPDSQTFMAQAQALAQGGQQDGGGMSTPEGTPTQAGPAAGGNGAAIPKDKPVTKDAAPKSGESDMAKGAPIPVDMDDWHTYH